MKQMTNIFKYARYHAISNQVALFLWVSHISHTYSNKSWQKAGRAFWLQIRAWFWHALGPCRWSCALQRLANIIPQGLAPSSFNPPAPIPIINNCQEALRAFRKAKGWALAVSSFYLNSYLQFEGPDSGLRPRSKALLLASSNVIL